MVPPTHSNRLPVVEDLGLSWVELSGSGPKLDPAAPMPPEDLRRLRRLISNRESARRCRLRKQRHLDELRARASRLRVENCELARQLRDLAHRYQIVRRDNEHLHAEASDLVRRLADFSRVLAVPHLHHLAAAAYDYEQSWAPLIAWAKRLGETPLHDSGIFVAGN